jgi:hypothetical protein
MGSFHPTRTEASASRGDRHGLTLGRLTPDFRNETDGTDSAALVVAFVNGRRTDESGRALQGKLVRAQ